MSPDFVSWLTWIAGCSGLAVGLSLGYSIGARRGGRAWMAGFMRGGEAGITVTLDAFEESAVKGRASRGPKDRFLALADAERKGLLP